MESNTKLRQLIEVIASLLVICEVSFSADSYLLVESSEQRLQNNSIVDPSTISSVNGIRCCGDVVDTWSYPNGSIIRLRGDLLVVTRRPLCVRMHLETDSVFSEFTASVEGVYTCNTRDSDGLQQLLFIGIYTTDSYQNSFGPVLTDNVTVELLFSHVHYPPSFSLHCPTTSYPPTTVFWSLDVAGNNIQLPNYSSKIITDKLATNYNNSLTVNNLTFSGRLTFTCTVTNSRGSMNASRTLLVPSGPPTDLSVDTSGNNEVIVRWTPPENVLGYTMAYTTGGSTGLKFFDNYIGDNATLMDVIAGNNYSITMQAFGDLPGPISNPITITLRAVPAPSISSVTTLSSTSINVQWIILNTTDIITGFRVSYAPRNNQYIGIRSDRQVVVGGQARHHSLTGLQEGVEYNITVQARGEQGYGEDSVLIVGKTLDAVPTAPPMNVTAVLSESGIAVSWLETPCEHINSLAGLTGFMVRYRPKEDG